MPFNQTLPTGQNGAPTLATAEEALPATVSCSIHPWMRGYMLPRKDKYFAVTKPDGSFEISNLPAGEDVEIAGLARAGQRPRRRVGAGPQGFEVDQQGRFKVKLEPDQTTGPGAGSSGRRVQVDRSGEPAHVARIRNRLHASLTPCVVERP